MIKLMVLPSKKSYLENVFLNVETNEYHFGSISGWVENKIIPIQLYLIDTNATVNKRNWVYNENAGNENNFIFQCNSDASVYSAKEFYKSWHKIIATTDFELQLPLFWEVEEWLEFIGQEVEVDWHYEEDTSRGYVIGRGQPAIKYAILK